MPQSSEEDITALYRVNLIDNNDGTVTISFYYQNKPEPTVVIVRSNLQDWFRDLETMSHDDQVEFLIETATVVPDSVD